MDEDKLVSCVSNHEVDLGKLVKQFSNQLKEGVPEQEIKLYCPGCGSEKPYKPDQFYYSKRVYLKVDDFPK